MISRRIRRRSEYTSGSTRTTAERRWRIFGGDGSRDPFPLLLEGAVVQGDACKLLLHAPEQEEISRRKVRRIGGVAEDLDVVGDEPILDDGGGTGRCPNGKTRTAQPSQASSSWNASWRRRGPSRCTRRWRWTPSAKKASSICLLRLAWTFALIGPGSPFSIHYWDCFLLWGMW